MGFDTVFNRNCPHRRYITSNKRNENSSRCQEAWNTVWEVVKTTLRILRTNRHTRGRQELSSLWEKKCMKCQKFNHFSSVCKSKGPPNSKKWQEQRPNLKPTENPGHKRRVKGTTEEEDAADDEFSCQAVRHLKQVKKIKAAGEDRTVSVKIEDVDVRAEPDSGAEVNVLDEHQFKALTNRSSVKLTLQLSRDKRSTLQSELPVKGEFIATVRNQTCGAVATFVVVRGRINSPPLISKRTRRDQRPEIPRRTTRHQKCQA